jgi:hypothetical protein
MAKGKYKRNLRDFHDPLEIERTLVARIAETGKEQLKKTQEGWLVVLLC